MMLMPVMKGIIFGDQSNGGHVDFFLKGALPDGIIIFRMINEHAMIANILEEREYECWTNPAC